MPRHHLCWFSTQSPHVHEMWYISNFGHDDLYLIVKIWDVPHIVSVKICSWIFYFRFWILQSVSLSRTFFAAGPDLVHLFDILSYIKTTVLAPFGPHNLLKSFRYQFNQGETSDYYLYYTNHAFPVTKNVRLGETHCTYCPVIPKFREIFSPMARPQWQSTSRIRPFLD